MLVHEVYLCTVKGRERALTLQLRMVMCMQLLHVPPTMSYILLVFIALLELRQIFMYKLLDSCALGVK